MVGNRDGETAILRMKFMEDSNWYAFFLLLPTISPKVQEKLRQKFVLTLEAILNRMDKIIGEIQRLLTKLL